MYITQRAGEGGGVANGGVTGGGEGGPVATNVPNRLLKGLGTIG